MHRLADLVLRKLTYRLFDSECDPILELFCGEFDIEISEVLGIDSVSKRSLKLMHLLGRNYLLTQTAKWLTGCLIWGIVWRNVKIFTYIVVTTFLLAP